MVQRYRDECFGAKRIHYYSDRPLQQFSNDGRFSVASGIDVIGGLYLKLTAGGQIQVDLDGGGNAWTTVANINGSGAVDMRYLSAGSASQLSVSRSANAPELNPKTTTAAVQPELEPDRRLALMVQDMANFGASAFHGQRIEPHWDRPADIFAAIS